MVKQIALAVVVIGASVSFPARSGAQPVAPVGRCLHGPNEQASQRTRREQALKLAQQINLAEHSGATLLPAQPKREYRPFAELSNLPATPPGFKLRFYTDVESYTFSLKDTLDACEYAIFSDQDKGIYDGTPQSGVRALPLATR